MLQNRDKQCEFCTNPKLLDQAGNSKGVHVWEFQNLVSKRWYQCRDEAIPWVDGLMVHIEIAIDITERKQIELELVDATEKYKHLANTDSLTACMNHRAFTEAAERIVSQSTRKNSSFSLVLMNIDYFKKFNDQHGHRTGDEVLIKLTKLIKTFIRKEDLFARFGGEEFILLLPDTNIKDSIQLLQRIRTALSSIKIDSIDSEFKLTMSFGITEFKAEKNLDQLIHDADIALYQAKDNGRNRIETYQVYASEF